MKKKAFIIILLLLVVSVIDSIYVRLSAKKYACYVAEFKLVDDVTGKPLNPHLYGPSNAVTAQLRMDEETGYGRVIWMAEDSIPSQLSVSDEGYQKIPLPEEAIVKIRNFSARGGILNPEIIKLKRK